MKLQNAKSEMHPEDAERILALSGRTWTVKATNLRGQKGMPKTGRTVVVCVHLQYLGGDALHVPVKVVEKVPGDFSWSYNGPLCESQQWRWIVEFPDMEALLDKAETIGARKAERAAQKRIKDGKKSQLIRSAQYGFKRSCWHQEESLKMLERNQLEGLLLSVSEKLNGQPVTDKDWVGPIKESTKLNLVHLVGSVSELLAQPC
jgi:choline dehydrogenase-like flavoprotein